MKIFKRFTAIFLAALTVSLCVVSAGASNIKMPCEARAFREYFRCDVTSKVPEGLDAERLGNVIREGIERCDERIDLTSFNISYTSENKAFLSQLVWNIPTGFCVVDFYFKLLSPAGGAVADVVEIDLTYRYEKAVCLSMIAEFKSKAAVLTSDLAGNTLLTDAEKVLLVHDRLALLCEYDYDAALSGSVNSPLAFEGYGALVMGKAVCSGYSAAYLYMMQLLGIPCRFCSSESLNHRWNIVTVGGKDYHVDVTWDDPIWATSHWNTAGCVEHEFFLLSSDAIKAKREAKGHEFTVDYDTSPSDTTYDNYYWQDSETAFQLIGNKLYYIDSTANKLKCAADGSELYDMGFWNDSKLAGDGEKLYFSYRNDIYEYDVAADGAKVIYTLVLPEGDPRRIYGFARDGDCFICDINTYAGFSNTTNAERIRVCPSPTPPEPTELVLTDGSPYRLNTYVDCIAPLSTAADVKSEFKNADVRINDGNGNLVENGAVVGTGFTISCFVNGAETEVKAAVVRGDLNGDGNINGADYISGKMAMTGQMILSGEFETAFDLNFDSVSSAADIVAIRMYIAG